jgi:hypothetical protein
MHPHSNILLSPRMVKCDVGSRTIDGNPNPGQSEPGMKTKGEEPWVRPLMVLSCNQQQYEDDYRNQSEPCIK